jgi:predicted TIM-barrel fold metal-dependent hydrolase
MHRFWFLCAAVLLVACRQAPPPQANKATETKVVEKYGVFVQAGPMDSVLLKDYHPKSSLVVPQTFVEKAKYPVVDAHAHSSLNKIRTPEDAKSWVQTMDEVGIETTVAFTDAIGADFDKAAELLKPYGNRFLIYCSIDTTNIDAPDYPQRATVELERCYRKGARGVGELTDKGWGLMNATDPLNIGGGKVSKPLPRDRRMHTDDPRLDLFWEKCAELKLPVNLHVADHPSAWQPLGPEQERTPDFQVFSMVGKDVPSYEEILASFDRALARHPHTTFIAAHLGNQGNDLSALAKELDRYPNLYVDISARDYELGREPRFALQFLTRYKDRVMFGTDMGRDKAMYQGWWRLLETGDEFMPGRQWWRQYGLQLPAPVLNALYRGTAKRVLNWEKP